MHGFLWLGSTFLKLESYLKDYVGLLSLGAPYLKLRNFDSIHLVLVERRCANDWLTN